MEQENKFRCRPFLSFTKESTRSEVEFTKPPFRHKQPKIGNFTMIIPFMNGKAAALVLPNNYCQQDLEIVLAQLEVIRMSIKR